MSPDQRVSLPIDDALSPRGLSPDTSAATARPRRSGVFSSHRLEVGDAPDAVGAEQPRRGVRMRADSAAPTWEAFPFREGELHLGGSIETTWTPGRQLHRRLHQVITRAFACGVDINRTGTQLKIVDQAPLRPRTS